MGRRRIPQRQWPDRVDPGAEAERGGEDEEGEGEEGVREQGPGSREQPALTKVRGSREQGTGIEWGLQHLIKPCSLAEIVRALKRTKERISNNVCRMGAEHYQLPSF